MGITKEETRKIYESKPFKTRNADEYDLENILDLFIDPTDGLIGPFEFSNSIVKGKMGSGKTMYLRANYAYYLYTLVPCLIDCEKIILPIYIRLSDFQNIHDAEKIYKSIIIKIIEEIVNSYKYLQNSDELSKLHTGASTLSGLWATDDAFSEILFNLQKISSSDYVKKVSDSFNTKGSASANFISAYAEYEKNVIKEIKINTEPSFLDITKTCENLITNFNGKLLILFDEVGSLDSSFFKSNRSTSSYFETLMNQLRTLPYVRTKIAVYPHTFSDSLMETRYGDIIELECDMENIIKYNAFIEKTTSLIEKYIEKATKTAYKIDDVFDITYDDQRIIEQLINASRGNMRRLVHILDTSMNISFENSKGYEKVALKDVLASLRRQGEEMENKLLDKDRTFLISLVDICKKRSTFKFTFPYKTKQIKKYANLSEEYNIISIKQNGTGRQSTIYSFDYAYCVYRDIPTHYLKASEKIDKDRSSINGELIQKITHISDELFTQAKIRGKIEGKISFLSDKKDCGFIQGNDEKTYFMTTKNVINSDKQKKLHTNTRVSFIPSKIDDTLMATEIEILE